MAAMTGDGERAGSRYDVAILGGGLAGLTLAIQVKRARPETSVIVLEKKDHPVPEAAHKVGESSLHIGAQYFERACGLGEHLESQQLRKMGLRFFLAEDRKDIVKRTEMGLATWVDAAPQYQLDRGRFENALGALASDEYGIEFVDGCAVDHVDLEPGGHRVSARRGDAEMSIECSWLVDASGRRAILKHKLGLLEENTHHCNAAWFRIGKRIKLDDFSDDPEWVGRVPSATRWQSTNHLLGPGYWFWLIPLASDSTSFGLVADPDLVPWEEMRRFEPLMEWLWRNEPQAAEVIEPHRDALQDFRILKHFSHSCKQVYSKDRWCITGEAGYFLDPLYSPGSDAICISNTLVTKFITESLDGQDVDDVVEFYNNLYLLLCKKLVVTWDHQYPIFANPGVSAAKFTWDYIPYLSGLALLVTTERIADMDFVLTVVQHLDRIAELNVNMQKLLRYWSDQDPDAASKVGYLGIREDRYLSLEADVAHPKDDPEWLRSTIARNAANVEAAAFEIIERAASSMGIDVDIEQLNPYVFDFENPNAPPPDDLLEHLTPLRSSEADSGLAWATEDDPHAPAHQAWSVWRHDAGELVSSSEAAVPA
jgi:flavin-dependent dehydrogenase